MDKVPPVVCEFARRIHLAQATTQQWNLVQYLVVAVEDRPTMAWEDSLKPKSYT
jgi:hypothetical protein